MIVCDEIKKPYLDFAPSLVVEILSPSTALKDRNTKYQLYEQEQIKYYLIIDTDTREVEIYELKDHKYALQSFSTPFAFQLSADCHISVELGNIFS